MFPYTPPILPKIAALSEHWADFFSQLFAPSEFTSALLERSFRQTSGWVEAGIVVALTVAMWWLSEWLLKRCTWKTPAYLGLLKHIGKRILWPVLMWFSAIIALSAWNFTGFSSVWLRLLLLAANWMIAIRITLAVFHAALPAKPWSDRLERTLSAVLWVFFLLWISGIDDIIINWMKSLTFSVGSSKLSLWSISTGTLWIGIILIFAMWLARFLRVVLVVLSVLIALPLVGIDLTVLSVFGGALGVGIGFGLQKVASNYISGFLILGDRSIRPGDRLTVNNFTGYVTKITSRFVVLRSPAGTEALIPNETFITDMVINESYTAKALQQNLNIQVSYDSDIARAMEIMIEAASRQERIDTGGNPPKAYLIGFGSDGIDLRLGFWVKDPENGFLGLFSAILLEIWQRFNEEGISFPFPQREVRILNEAPILPDQAKLSAAAKQAAADTRSHEPMAEEGGQDAV